MGTRELSRRLGAWDAGAIVVGTIIGSGIFIVPGSIARALPAADWMLGIWVAAGALSLCGALAFAELGAMFPHTGDSTFTFARLTHRYGLSLQLGVAASGALRQFRHAGGWVFRSIWAILFPFRL